jgi:hypothetical protein
VVRGQLESLAEERSQHQLKLIDGRVALRFGHDIKPIVEPVRPARELKALNSIRNQDQCSQWNISRRESAAGLEIQPLGLAPALFCLTDATSNARGATAAGRDWALSGGGFRTPTITGVATVTTPATTSRSCFQEFSSRPSWLLMIASIRTRERPA